jgi:hypothetical protein
LACQTYFDLINVGYRYWWLVLAGCAASLVGVLFVAFRKQVAAISSRKYPEFVPFAFLGTVVSVTLLFAGSSYSAYANLRQAELDGKVMSVEGIVANFTPMQRGRGNFETFTVDGSRFRYSDAVLSPGFNTSSLYGGPIRSGRYVRILHRGNDIAKLEICSSN